MGFQFTLVAYMPRKVEILPISKKHCGASLYLQFGLDTFVYTIAMV